MFAADDRIQRRLGPGHHLAHRRTDQTDLLSQLAPIGFAVAPAQHANFAAGRCQVTGQRAQQRCFARTVRAEDNPVLSAPDAPGNTVENRCSPAPDVQAANFQDRFRLALHAANIFVKTPQEAKQMSLARDGRRRRGRSRSLDLLFAPGKNVSPRPHPCAIVRQRALNEPAKPEADANA